MTLSTWLQTHLSLAPVPNGHLLQDLGTESHVPVRMLDVVVSN